MKKQNFTAGRVAAFVCEPGKQQTIFWDGKTPGLGLRVTASGTKAYIFETRLHGKTLRLTIGDPQTWTLKKAQDEATHLKALTDKGINPREQEAEEYARRKTEKADAERQRKRESLTLGDAWPIYIEARKTRWGKHSYHDHIRVAAVGGDKRKRSKKLTTAGPLASLLPMRLSDLTGDRLAAWLEQEKTKRPTSAARTYRLLRGFIRWTEGEAQYSGIIPADAYRTQKVKEAVPRTRAKEGDCLQREHLPVWFAQVRRLPNPVIAAYLQALLLTGARREEMVGLKWEDVDFQWRSLTIRDKVEGSRTIPLPPYLASLLFALPRRNEWVFSSPTAANGKLTDPRIAHNAALDAAGLPHVTLHGLRRSFGTLAEWVEVPSGISAQIMGHKPSALAEKHYRRRPLDLLRKWHDKIEAWMLEQAGIVFDATEEAQRWRVVK